MSAAEEEMALHLKWCKVTGWVREHRFCPPRRWRFDFAWPEQRLAVEVDGGAWTRGRHTRGVGVEKDNEKFAAAAIKGWRVIRVTPGQIKGGTAVRWVMAALHGRVQGEGGRGRNERARSERDDGSGNPSRDAIGT